MPVVEETHDLQNDNEEEFEANRQTNDDNGSSNYGFDDNLTYEQSIEKEEMDQTDETTEQETFMPDPADLENANSFPSGNDDNSAQQSDNNMQEFTDTDRVFLIDDETSDQSSDKLEDTFAQSEEAKQDDPDATSLDAENISEDELPAPAKPKVQDAEEVSDEELPGPKMAELPADTEVVSEDELPTEKKKDGKRKHEDYDPCDPTDESDEKKAKTDGELVRKCFENFFKQFFFR